MDILGTESTRRIVAFCVKHNIFPMENLEECVAFLSTLGRIVQNGDKNIFIADTEPQSIKQQARRLFICATFFAPCQVSVSFDKKMKNLLVFLVQHNGSTEYTICFEMNKANKKVHKINNQSEVFRNLVSRKIAAVKNN